MKPNVGENRKFQLNLAVRREKREYDLCGKILWGTIIQTQVFPLRVPFLSFLLFQRYNGSSVFLTFLFFLLSTFLLMQPSV